LDEVVVAVLKCQRRRRSCIRQTSELRFEWREGGIKFPEMGFSRDGSCLCWGFCIFCMVGIGGWVGIMVGWLVGCWGGSAYVRNSLIIHEILQSLSRAISPRRNTMLMGKFDRPGYRSNILRPY
jgi:hypothetical protein